MKNPIVDLKEKIIAMKGEDYLKDFGDELCSECPYYKIAKIVLDMKG